ncbi:hypothetical protein PflQ2_0383 [Pseudomonas fluorescens Q2-87]|uniref:Uncharacterized protein n=1 Tax=Pseudomonas fluorescens (strain Q2-87) TaxID=1038922 RepID=J2XWX7_PSEFQ|nr:hypothetical protein PflQ2_0383 [Pseudomonas fluorescens Q2-87]
MLNRLRFIQLVHAQQIVEMSQGHPIVDFTKDWQGIIGENAGNHEKTQHSRTTLGRQNAR